MQKDKSPTSRPKQSNYTGRLLLKPVKANTNAFHEDITTAGQLLEDTGGMMNEIPAMFLHKSISQMTAVEKMIIVREGISKIDLEYLKNTAALDYDQLAWALSVTRATLINKKGTEKFNSSLSERIVSLADIYAYGYEVFEDDDSFNNWILRPNKALGGQPPYDLLDNQFGREEVRNIIGRIDYGVYS
jgi:putative toxin-antitoxin system antitoxin component (TIGR02293 family)